jgi:hypothetical protein
MFQFAQLQVISGTFREIQFHLLAEGFGVSNEVSVVRAAPVNNFVMQMSGLTYSYNSYSETLARGLGN